MKFLSYDQVALVPNLGVVRSRSECNTYVKFLGQKFRSPVIPANMRASIDMELAKRLARQGYFYVLHRFYPYEEIKKFIAETFEEALNCSISIGVQRQDYELIEWMYDTSMYPDYITIDIAHGHSLAVKNMLEYINNVFYKDCYKPKVIAGNVATANACQDLIRWGADAIKIGIGQGHTCTTRLQTGFGLPMFSCVLDCVEDGRLFTWKGLKKVPIIADGGISHYGDAAKAIVAGADMVMVGSMFARCIDSPAESLDTNGSEYNITTSKTPTHKRWFGSASEHNKGKKEYVEGIERIEPCNGLTYWSLYSELDQALKSAVSYAGGTELSDLKTVNWKVVK